MFFDIKKRDWFTPYNKKSSIFSFIDNNKKVPVQK